MDPDLIDLAEVRADQKEIKERLYSLKERLVQSGKEAVEEKGHVTPVVASLGTAGKHDTNYIYPTFKDEEGEKKTYSIVNQHLEESQSVGAVSMLQVMWVDDEDLTHISDVLDHADARPAIMITIHSGFMRELWAYPFNTEEGIEWLDPLGPITDFEDTLITAFETH